MTRRTLCYDIMKGDGCYWRIERDDLYSDTKAHIEALRVLSNPHAITYHHEKNQREWLNSTDTFKYKFDDVTLYIRFCFDHTEAEREKLVKANWRKVDLNDE